MSTSRAAGSEPATRRGVSETNVRLLELRLVEGRDVAETAAELGISAEQVWYRQHRMVKKPGGTAHPTAASRAAGPAVPGRG
ncbi:MAG TPA: hypothetical protein VML55_22140 [Planctomycetaceae bacterium]|nr:hypothetical protein [Planctomycetaceae bacterium]